MLKQTIIYSLFTLTLLNAGSAESEIGINIGMNSTKNDTGATFENPSLGVTLQYNNYVIMPRFDLEYVKLQDEKANSLLKGSLNGLYEFETGTNITPYALAGAGYENVQGGTENEFESHPFIHAGGGLSIDLINEYKANIEGRFLQILGGENEENEAVLTAGIAIPLGSTPPIKRVSRPIVRPQPVRVVPPRIVYLNNNECSVKTDLPDLDRDGVEDRRDQCPATPCNFTVDDYGCPVKTTLKINFESGSAYITDASKSRVDSFAKFLLKNRGSMVKIIGHTDSVGSAKSNLELSKRRANAVKQALLIRGVSAARLYAQGRGESRPIASNDTLSGRAMNRRIEAELSYPKGRR